MLVTDRADSRLDADYLNDRSSSYRSRTSCSDASSTKDSPFPTRRPSIRHSQSMFLRQSLTASPNARSSMVISPEEYNSLPPSIQKKYFSSVERLRIAQESASQKRKKRSPTHEPWLSPRSSVESSSRPKSAHNIRASSSFSLLKKTLAVRQEADVDEAQALRFLALPDKVKRSHFTIEELVVLTESCERTLGPLPVASPADGIYQTRPSAGRKGSVTSSNCRSSRSDDLREDVEKDWFDLETESVNSFEHSHDHDMEAYKLCTRRRQGSITSILPPLSPLSHQESVRSTTPIKPFSSRRALSLAPLPLPPPRLTPAVPPLPSPNTLKSFQSKGQPATASSPVVESNPATKYYKDAQARQNLRHYFSSPEKFDEAIEFGFASERPNNHRAPSVTSSTDPGLHTEADSSSVTNSGDEDDDCSVRSPTTPSMLNNEFSNTVMPHASLDSGVAMSCSMASLRPSIRSQSPEIDGRHMTLRLTLTRPELRAPDEELYAFQRKPASKVDIDTSDPLALEALPVCEDHTGAQGAFAVRSRPSEKSFKKVWKTIRGR